jgi:hypothetical protein
MNEITTEEPDWPPRRQERQGRPNIGSKKMAERIELEMSLRFASLEIFLRAPKSIHQQSSILLPLSLALLASWRLKFFNLHSHF